MLLDMDRLKRAEEAAAAARDQAANVLASVREPLLVLDAELRVETANPAFQRVFGIDPGELSGKSIFAVGNRQWDIPRLRTLLEEILPRDATVEDFRVEHDLPGRGRRTMLLNARRIDNPERRTERILLAIEDITDQLHFQAAVRHSELRYRRLFETARDGVLLLDPVSRKIVDANPFMSELLGYSLEELVGKELFEIGLLKDEADSQAAFRELRKTGFIRYEDLPLESKSGQRREVEMVSNLYTEAEDNIIQCNIRDITQRKLSEEAILRSEQELSARVEELAAIDSAKGRFLAVLAHELRSPLNAIRGWLQILQRPGRTEQDLLKGLEVIDRNSKIQIDLISDLLDAHRIGAGKAALELRSIDLHDSIEAALATAQPAAAEMEIQLEREIDPAPAPVSADPGRLQQVLGNLLTNALKFTPRGGRIRISLRRTAAHVEVSVADTGEGISAEALPHIFEPYRQAEAEAGRGHGGLGLGLTIAKQILMLHGGSIEARSAGHGHGATFTITLPLRGPAESARHAVLPATRPEERPGMLGGLLVLVVDDEPDAREPVRRVLEEAGAEVVAVASAEEAMEAVRQQRPDVLVSDIGMPGQDGYDLIRSIQALPPGRGGQVPAIALTAYAAAEDRDRALQAGYRTHLAKPVEPAVLIAAIAALASPNSGAGKQGAK
jgi:PAS domain S-box-containing protein